MLNDLDLVGGDPIADLADAPIARHRAWTAVALPVVIVRFTARSAIDAASVYLHESATDTWRIPYGLSFEVRAAWTFDQVFSTRNTLTQITEDH